MAEREINYKIKIDTESVKSDIAELKKEISKLKKESKITPKIDTDSAKTDIAELKKEISKLKKSASITPKINKNNAKAYIAELKKEISKLGKESKIKPEVDTQATKDKLVNTITGSLQSGIPSFTKSGNILGTVMGGAIGGAVGSVIVSSISSAISAGVSLVSTVGSFALESINSYKEYQKGGLQLQGAIRAINNENSRSSAIINDSTKSYEQRANALGLDSKKIYENVSASQQASKASSGLKTEINDLERALKEKEKAFNKSQNALQKEISLEERALKALQKKNEETLKSARLALGSQNLEDTRKSLESRITELEIQKTTAELNGEFTIEIDEQLLRLRKEKDLNQDKLTKIDQQTESIKEQGKAIEQSLIDKVEVLRNKIEDNKFVFEADIDITNLKDKIENLREQVQDITIGASGGGTTKKLKDNVKSLIDNYSKELKDGVKKSISQEDFAKAEAQIISKYGEYTSRGVIRNALSNIVKGGADSEQAVLLFDRFAESATSGRSKGLAFADALDNLSFAYATNNSQLGNLAGLRENFDTDIIPKGIENLKQQYLEQGRVNDAQRLSEGLLTSQEEALAKFNGTLFYTNDTIGSFDTQKPTLEIDRLQTQFTRLREELGEELSPAFNDIIRYFGDLLSDFVNGEGTMGAIKQDFKEIRDELKKLFTEEDKENLKRSFQVILEGLSLIIKAVEKVIELYVKMKENWEKIPEPARVGLKQFGVVPKIPGFASGGYIDGPGTSTSDSILARLSRGEFVLNAEAVSKLGRTNLEAINNMSTDNSIHDNSTMIVYGNYSNSKFKTI